jgi:Arc/MetJ-type ribon-helix-helix transcriptional regulator
MLVSTQIAVRLPDSLVAWIDEQVATGGGSRAAVTTKALRRYQRHVNAMHDAELMRRDPFDDPGEDAISQWAQHLWDEDH